MFRVFLLFPDFGGVENLQHRVEALDVVSKLDLTEGVIFRFFRDKCLVGSKRIGSSQSETSLNFFLSESLRKPLNND